MRKITFGCVAFSICLLIGIEAKFAKNNDTGEATFKEAPTTSPNGMVALLHTEENFIEILDHYVDLAQEKINQILLILKEVKTAQEYLRNDTEAYLSNPLNSFALIRRLHSDWTKWMDLVKAPIHQDDDFVDKLQAKLPSEMSYELAIEGIHRIQQTYSLNVEDMVAGLVGGEQYNATFSPLDCFEIGIYLATRKEYISANKWFQSALSNYNGPYSGVYNALGLTEGDIWYNVAEQMIGLGKTNNALKAINTAIYYNPHNEAMRYFKQMLEELLEHDRICRGDYVKTSKFLHCRYKFGTSAFLKLAPFKLEEMSLEPYIALYHDVVYESEMAYLKYNSLPNLRRSLVGVGSYSSERTAQSSYIFNITKIDQRIDNRFADLTDSNLELSEKLHVMNYGIGGHHYNHVDHFEHSLPSNSSKFLENRMIAVLIYLSDVVEGGATAFPSLGIAVPSRKGTGVVFNLLNNVGDGDERFLHAACPVLVGSKWAAVKMLMQSPQMFIKPCLKPNYLHK